MSDGSTQLETSTPREVRSYSDDEKYQALAFLDICGGNQLRAAKAAGVPRATLIGWMHEREAKRAAGVEPSSREKEQRGDLASKMEYVIHSLVESMPSKIDKATLSQAAVATGILTDKVRIIRSTGLDPDPQAELCRLLGINRAQLPASLELAPGEELPEGFADIIDMQPTSDGQGFEPIPTLSPRYHHPDIGTVLTLPNQDNLPPGYVRVLASINGAQPEYTLKLSELQPVTLAPDEDPNSDALINSIPDEDQEN